MVEEVCREIVKLMTHYKNNPNDKDVANEVIECLILINSLYFSTDSKKFYDLFINSMEKNEEDRWNGSIIDILREAHLSSHIMVYSLYLCHIVSGKVLLNISFKEMPECENIVGSFFSAINHFLSALLFENCDNPEKINYMEIGSYAINIIPVLVRNDIDMILIHDKPRTKKEKNELNCLFKKLLKVFITHGENFVDWDECNVGIFGDIVDPLICNVKEWVSLVNPSELQNIIV